MKVQQYTLDLLQIVLSRCVDVKTCLLSHSTLNDKIDDFMSGVVYLLPDVKAVIAIRQIIFSKKKAGEQKMEEDEQEDGNYLFCCMCAQTLSFPVKPNVAQFIKILT